jgi:hypothetical protein
MNAIGIILAAVILLLAAYIVVMNWACVIVSVRNNKRGIDRHHSTVPLISFFITIFAMMACAWCGAPKLAVWMLIVPLLDIANWSLVFAPFGLIREMCRRKVAEPAASRNGGPARRAGKSVVGGGPPSVS